jgi:hypothetical protein
MEKCALNQQEAAVSSAVDEHLQNRQSRAGVRVGTRARIQGKDYNAISSAHTN